METGANKPNHSLIDTKSLESQSIKDCHLSIQIGLNGFSFCIRNSAEILAIESYNNSLSQLEESIEKNKWLITRVCFNKTSLLALKNTP